MRNLIFFLTFVFYFSLTAMDTPSDEKTLTWELFHMIDKWTDPLSYFTDPTAPKICADVMRFGLATTDPNYRFYTGDAECLKDVKSALSRQRALIISLEAECKKDDGSKVELLRDAFERQRGYFSQNVLSLIESYLERSTQTARNTALVLNGQAGKTLEAPQTPTHLAHVQTIQETRAISYKTIENLVMEKTGMMANTVNFVRKNYTDPLKYLTDEKAQSICLAMRYLHPCHQFHVKEWQFNNKLEFHLRLIHQVLERETKLTYVLQYALENNKEWMVININPENPDLKPVMANIASSYSPLVSAIIKGYLTSQAIKKQREVEEKERKEKEQKEFLEKSNQISGLISFLHKKFSDATLADKLKEKKPELDSLKAAIIGRSLGPQEIIKVHAQLTQLNDYVTQVLSTAIVSPTAVSSVTHNATVSVLSGSNPVQVGASSPTTPPSQSPAATITAASPTSPAPEMRSNSPASSAPTTPELAPAPPSKSPSPKASPQPSPTCSLVVAPTSEAIDEDFNPRAPRGTEAVSDATPPAAAKPAESKQTESKGRRVKGK